MINAIEWWTANELTLCHAEKSSEKLKNNRNEELKVDNKFLLGTTQNTFNKLTMFIETNELLITSSHTALDGVMLCNCRNNSTALWWSWQTFGDNLDHRLAAIT